MLFERICDWLFHRRVIVLDVPVITYGAKTKAGYVYQRGSIDVDALNIRAKDRVLLGGIGQYDTGSYFSMMNPRDASHMITDVRDDFNHVYVDIKSMPNDKGRELAKLVKHGMVEFKPRCLGTVSKGGEVTINKVVSFDAVPKRID